MHITTSAPAKDELDEYIERYWKNLNDPHGYTYMDFLGLSV